MAGGAQSRRQRGCPWTLSHLPLSLPQATAPLRIREEGLVPCPLSASAPDGSSQPSFSLNHPPQHIRTDRSRAGPGWQWDISRLPPWLTLSAARVPFQSVGRCRAQPARDAGGRPCHPSAPTPVSPGRAGHTALPCSSPWSLPSLMSLLGSYRPQERPAFFSPLLASQWTLSLELRLPFPENTWPWPIPAHRTSVTRPSPALVRGSAFEVCSSEGRGLVSFVPVPRADPAQGRPGVRGQRDPRLRLGREGGRKGCSRRPSPQPSSAFLVVD